jgi:hypothetical protein
LIKIKIKQRLVCALLAFVSLAGVGTLLRVYAGKAMNPVVYWTAGDPNVRVRAEISSVKLIRREKNELQFRIQAHIRITNVSTDPVFVFGGLASDKYQYPLRGSVNLARTEAQALSGRYVVHNNGMYPSLDNSLYWQVLSNKLDQETPPADLIRRIELKEFWEFDREIVFGIDNYSWMNELDEIRRDPHVWLEIELVMWPNLLDSPYELGQSLQKRWRPGHLIFRSLYTEPVELTLPLK